MSKHPKFLGVAQAMLMSLLTILLLLGVASNQVFAQTPCGNISPLLCPEVVKTLPVNFTFSGSEGGLSNTGFTMADPPSARLVADNPVFNNSVPGYEPSKLAFASDRLVVSATKGLQFRDNVVGVSSETNSQINALGVGFQANTPVRIQTTIVNPNFSLSSGNGNSQQAGLWFGLNENNYVKLVLVRTATGTNSARVQMLVENYGALTTSAIAPLELNTADISTTINTQTVILILDLVPNSNTAKGSYKLNNGAEVVLGTMTLNLTTHTTTPSNFFNGTNHDSDAGTPNVSYAGIFTSLRRATSTPTIPFAFEDFSIVAQNLPPTFTASTFTTFDDLPIGTKIGKVTASDPEGQALTYSITAGNTGNAFAINNQGEISINQDLTGTSTYTLTVQVSDGVNPVVSGTTTVNLKAVIVPSAPINLTKINFQDASDASLPSGYLKDFGQGFDLRTAANQGNSTLTYGWIGVNATYPQQPADLTALGRNRNLSPSNAGIDLKIATFMHMEHPTVTNPRGYWEMAVPNGQYLVTVSVGEAQVSLSPDEETHRINAEGINIINNFQPTGVANALTRFTSGAKVVTVSDGRLTLDYSGGGKNTKINYVEVQSYVNTAPALANAIPNQIGNINTAFTYTFPANTFTDIEPLTYTASLANNDPLPAWLTFTPATRTFSGTPSTSATYTIKVTASDGTFSTNDEFDLVIEGLPNANPVIINNSGTFNIFEDVANATSIVQVNATDADAGQILTYQITSGNTGNAFSINANGNLTVAGTLDYGTTPVYTLVVTVTDNGSPAKSASATYTVRLSENITTANFPYQINFQDPNTLPPSGWIKDFGQPFGSRTNPQQGSGFNYGWRRYDNVADLDLTLNGRNRNRASIPLLQNTLLHMQGNDLTGFSGTAIEGKWEITVPNGWYQVTVSVGDQPGANSVYDSQHTLNVEGVNAINQFQATSSNEFNSASVTVQVTDGNLTIDAGGTNGNNTKINSAVIVQTTPPNQAPILTIANFNVAEDATVNSTVATATANETVTFSLDAGTPFTIDANSGEIKLASALNFETTTSYTLNITATDGGSPAVTDTETITVTITNVNENPTIADANFTIAENANVNDEVGNVVASDVDANTTLQYSITAGNTNNAFAIDGTGKITLANALNFETLNNYALTVLVSDGALTDEATVNISVTNFNESPSVTIADFSLPENQAVGVVATVTSNDPENQAVTYSLANGTPFSINENSGKISLNAALNFEATTSYTLNITATDGTNNIFEEVIVTITNINEAPTAQDASANLSEDANIGFEVLTVSASDPDANTTLQYQITAGNAAGDFAIDNTGKITVSEDIEFSTIVSYALTIQVSDGEFTDEATVNITVEEVIIPNQAPTADDATFTIAENANVNDVVGQVVASDPTTDLDDNTVTYSIIAGNEADKFEISASGQIKVKNTLDFETATSYTLTVKVSDSGVPVLNDEASIIINVTNVNENPTVTIADFSLPENQGTGVVATVTSNDPENQTVTYTLANGTSFSINETSGAISLNSALNFEATTSYTLNVTATDGTNNVSEEVLVTITNVNENPTVSDANFSIAENANVNDEVGSVVASDVDANTTLQYSITAGNTNNAFAINGTGKITLANALNFETLNNYALTVLVSDGELTDEASVNISVTNFNESPVVTIADFSLPENQALGVVATVTSNDPETNTVTYSLANGTPFSINETSGAISLNSALNFEATTSYTLNITATDGTNNVSEDVLVTITNVNENPSAASVTFTIAENVAVGTSVGQIVASDVDANTTLQYAISGTGASDFAISNTGAITVANALEFSTIPVYNLTVTVTDNGSPNLSATANVTINLTEYIAPNQNPVITARTFSIIENSAVNTNVGTVLASDPDAGQTLTYAITAGNTNNAFAIGNNGVLTVAGTLDYETLTSYALTVQVTDNGNPNLSASATITVNITDQICSPISTLECNQIKVPLNAPFVLNFNGSEGGLSNTGFTMVDAPSLRLAADGVISNPAVPGYESSKLSFSNGKLIINANKGIAYVKPTGTAVTSTETNSQINALGVGFDANDYNFSVQTTVINPYTDGSANSEQAGLWFGLDEANFVKLVAVNGSQIELRVEVGDNSDVVNLVAANGVTGLHTSNVTFRLQVNITALTVTGFYKLNNGTEVTIGTLPIPASYLNGKTINGEGISFAGVYASKRRELATTQVNYTFEDFSITPDIPVNQTPLIVAQTFNVNENAGAGTLVGTVVATAPEANQALTYTITPNNIFNINSSGQIIVVGALDFETTPSYNLNVTVTDNGTPNLSASATITVNVNNLQPQIVVTPNELIFDGVKNTTIGPKSLTVQNTGGDALVITSVSISGTNANKFTTTAAPITLGIGESTIVQSSFVPGATVGYLNATITFVSNDPTSPSKTVGLFGLSNNGLEGTNEPTLNNVVQTLGYGINVGWTTLADGTSASPKGEEVLVPLFQKAGAGEVGILPVARYSPTHQIFFGHYKNQAGTPVRTGVGELLPNSPHHQTLFPGLANGTNSFSIDNSAFGIFVQGLQGRFTYTEDALNAGGPAIHAARIYPMKDRNGVLVPNSYLVCFEDASNGDYQDYMFVLSNVKPAGSTLGTLQFAATPNSKSLQIGQNGTVQNLLNTSNNANVSTTLNALDNATGAVPTWLKVGGNTLNNINVTSGSPVIFQFDATSLAVGTYTAIVTATSPSYNNATIQLTLTVTNPIVIKVNFQDNSVASPIGYLKDIGDGFANRTGADQGNGQYSFGWVTPGTATPANLTTLARTRVGSLDLKIRTFNHMDHPTQTNPRGNWEIALPNGTYQVFVSVGEPLVGTDPEVHRVNAENVNIVNNFIPTGAQNSLTRFTTGSGVATVTDGRLTLSYSGGGVNTKLNYVEITSVQVNPGLQFATTPNSINLEIGQTGTIGNALATNNSTDPITATLNAIDNATSAVPIWLKVNNSTVNNLSFTTGAEISFVTNATGLAAGTYSATVTASANGYTNGTITLTMTVTAPVTLANFKVNFSDAATPAPTGFLKDFGQGYADRGNGQTYGWMNTARTAPLNLSVGGTIPGNGRNRLPDPDLDTVNETLMHMQGDDLANFNGTPTEGVWEALVPNGSYTVTVRVGDSQAEGSVGTRHVVNVEGINAVSQLAVQGSPNDFSGTVNVSVIDGKITLDAIGGVNTKIKSVVIAPNASGIQNPYVIAVNPPNNASNVIAGSGFSISANNLFLPNPDANGIYGVNNTTVTANSVKLYKVAGNVLIPSVANGTGGGDAITLTPSVALENSTVYRFEITSDVKDKSGQAFLPFSSTFSTSSGQTGTGNIDLNSVSFTKVATPVATGGQYTSLAIGPDSKMYGLTLGGDIHRWTISADGTLANKETLSQWKTIYGARSAVGLVFDPSSTANNLIAWISHCSSGLNNAPDWDGKISKISGPNLQNEQLVITNLPRSLRDHLTNSITFKSGEPNALYFNQGSNSAGGAPDGAWGNREESLLSGATLKLDLTKLPATLPLDAKTTRNTDAIKTTNINSPTLDGLYNPYFINAPLTIFASGIRNAYDLVWHSNGQLYVPANGTAGGSNSPASINGMRRPDGSFYDHSNPSYPVVPASNSNNVQRDWLFRVNPAEPIGYFGHPNPYRGEFVLNRGEIDVTSPAIYNNNNVLPDIRYRGAAFDFEYNKSPNGVIEYQSNAEGGKLKGALLVVRYSGGDDIIALVPNGTNGNIGTSKIGIPGFTGFSDPLDIIEDPNTGNIYVSEFAADKITLLKPSNQATATPVISLSPNKLISDDVSGGSAAPSQTVFISNVGNAPLNNINVTISGTNADQYSVNTANLSSVIESGQSSNVAISFNPTSNGPKFATLNVTGGNGAVSKSIPLNGLGKAGIGGGSEPSLQWILDTYFGAGVINVGDDAPSNNQIHSTNFAAPLLGNEVALQKFQSFTDGPVTVELLSVFGPTSSNPVVGFGWYISGDANAKNQLFTVSNNPANNGQTLNAPINGTLQFSPSTNDVFGFYSYWPAFGNRHLYSEDALNTFTGAIPHHVRVYPHPTENNAYIVATEEHISGFDFQDIVVIVRNVKPFAPSIPTLTFNQLNLNFNSNLNGNPDVQSVTLATNTPLNGTPIVLSSNQPWVILPNTVVTGTPMAFDVNPQGLGAGTYTANIKATATGFDDAELTITLSVTNEPSWTTKINFQDDSFTPPTGYIADIGLAYGDRGNGNTFGWINSTGVATANTTAARGDERGVTNASSDQVKLLSSLNMFQHSSNPNARWEIAVPNGNYAVKVSAGDPAFTDSEHTIRAEGIAAINAFAPTAQITHANAQVNVTVNDGKLTLDAVGGTNTKINYVLIAPVSTAQLAPIITANFTGSSNTPNIYQNTVSVALAAQDQSGSGIKTLSYSTNGGVNYTPYTVPIVFNQVATHNLTVKAEDNNGNISTQLFAFSVINYVASNAIVALENMTKIPGTQIAFPADDYYTFHKNLTGSSTALKYHNLNVMRVRNTGTGTLIVNSIVISNNTRFRINKINNVTFTANMIPLSINAGAFADIELDFIESAGGKGVRTETVTLTTNADNAISLTATLKGGFMTSVEGGNELNAIQTMSAFGFTTSMNGQPQPSSDYPLAADVDSGSEGDLIVSQLFAQADPTKPVRGFGLAAFKGSGPSITKLVNTSGATVGNFSYAFGNDYHQSLFPKSTNTSNLLAGDEAATITGSFRLQVDSYTTAGHGGTNASTGLPNVLGVRVYKVRDREGKLIPFHYIVIQDFVGSGCGAGSANCDWNDNVQYFMNIRPNALPTAIAIATQTVTVNQPFNFNIASSFNKGYPGNKLTYSANLSNLSALPAWMFLNSETGEFTGTAPLNAASPLSVAVTATDINGLTVTQTFTLNVIGTASGLAVVNKGHIDFGNTLSGSQNTQTLNVLNNAVAGGATMTLNSVQIIGANAAEFNASIVTNTANPQANASLNVTFTPQSNGLKQAVLLISNNFTATPLRVPLFGIGTDPCHTIQVVKRIKSGVNVNATVNGVVWENDQAYRSGNIKLDVPNVTSIAETSNDEVYIKYLSSNANLDIIQYNIPMPAGLYSVRLHFVENAFSAVNQRVFSGEIEGQSIFSNLDVFATVGRNTALVRDFSNITVGADNSMNIKFTPTVNRLALAGVEVFKFIPAAGALAFNANPTITNPTCASNNGSIQVNVSNTVGAVSYTLNGQSNSTGLFASLSAGSYTITASDGSGCAVSQTFVLTSGNVDFTVSSTPVSCNSNNNGTATIGNITGATGDVTISWNTNPVQTSLTATGLAVGQYQVTLTDAIGCFKTKTVSVVKSAGCGATTTRMEAEDHFIIVTDAPGNNIFIGSTDIASQNKDVRVYDVGDKIKFNFNAANAGQYILKMRGRSGWTTNTDAYWENPQGYGFKLDNATAIFTGNQSTISANSSTNFGPTGAFFGTMETQTLDLTAGTHSLEIEMKRQWLVVDYIEILYLGSQGPDITPPSAPVLSLESVGTNAIALSWSASTDNVGVTAYDVFNGANLAGTTASTNFTVNGLTAGLTYTFTVKAKDASANVSNASNPITATTNGGVDVTAPTAPTLTLGTITGTSVALSWTASTDNVGVTAYDIFNGASLAGTTSNLNFTVSGLSANTAYSLTVKAKDAANNSSVSSNAVNATTLNNADTQAPTAPVLSLGTVTNNSVGLTWTAATDNVAVTAYEIFNGASSVGTTSNLNFTVNGLSANTAYSFTVKAKDAAGNISVASNAVNATTTGGTTPTTTRYEAEIHYVIVSDVGTNGAIIVGNNNIASAGKDLRTYDIGDKFKIDFPVTGGQYQLKVHARSGYNASPMHYWNNPFGYSFKLDNAVTNFAANPSTVSATSTTAYGSVGAYFGTMETGTLTLNAGTHSLEITINRTWLGVDYLEVIYLGGGTSDTQAPTAPTLSLGTVTANSVALNWSGATDNVSVTAYEVYQGANLLTTTSNNSFNAIGLTANTAHAFTVKAKDAVGNSSVASNVINATTLAPPTSVRFEAETNFTVVSNVGTNGNIVVANNNIASAGKDVRAYDIGDKFNINFTVAQNGQYRLKVNNRAGWTVNPTGYWTPAGYAFKLNGTTTGFVGNPSTISPTVSTAYGSPGATFGTMESGIVNLSAGAHSLEIEMLKAWLGVDYLEVEFLGSTSGVANTNPTENAVEAKEAVTLAQDISKLYPNPVSTEDIYVEFRGEINGKVQYSILDAQGKVFAKQVINLDEPQYVIKIAIANLRLSQGVYYLYIKGDKLQEKIIRFVKN